MFHIGPHYVDPISRLHQAGEVKVLEIPVARWRCERKSISIGLERFLDLTHKFGVARCISGYTPSVLSRRIFPVNILTKNSRLKHAFILVKQHRRT